MTTLKNEPAMVTSLIVAILGVVAPAVVISNTQQATITAIVTAVIVLAGGFHIRGKVTPKSVASAAIADAQANEQEVSAVGTMIDEFARSHYHGRHESHS